MTHGKIEENKLLKFKMWMFFLVHPVYMAFSYTLGKGHKNLLTRAGGGVQGHEIL